MKFRWTRAGAALTLALFSAACTTTGGSESSSLSPAQRELRDYSTEYAAQGAIAGAALGCVAGLLLSSKNKGGACAAGAAVGGLAGGGTGYFLGQRQNQVGVASAGYALQKNELDGRVAEANRIVAASTGLAEEAKADIRRLQRQVASGQATNAQLAAKVRAAEEDRQYMVNASKKIQDTIDKMDSDVASGNASRSDAAYIKTKRAQLLAEKRKLDDTIRDLAGVTGAPVV